MYNIISVSAYERKILFRSWFFRIFASIALILLIIINILFFGNHIGAHWSTRAIPANLPYINVLFINIAQAVIAIFMASEFLRRDKKLDTTEVIYTRPVSNAEYVVGKTLGILSLFAVLVLMSLIITLVFNLVKKDTPVTWEAYLYYPLLIALPTLVYILGLSFFLMILFKNQAVTFLILLGYIGLTLFYFKGKQNGLLDYTALNLPMVYSDFIQFSDLHKILLHRLAYLFMGIGFIFATIRFINRLPQIGRWNSINLIAFFLFLSAGIFLGYRYHEIYRTEKQNRIQYLALNNQFAGKPVADIISNNIVLIQHDNYLSLSSELVISNPCNQKMDTLILSLNPGFNIDSITARHENVDYFTTGHIIQILPENGLEPGRRFRIKIYYTGLPDESIAYSDIPEEQRASLKSIQVAKLNKKAGIVSRDFLLLTQELLWYPVAGTGFNTERFLPYKPDFVRFRLTVTPRGKLIPVAPGRMEKEEGTYHFFPETDLPSFALIAGPFIIKEMELDGIEYSIFLKSGHDFFSGYFINIADTLSAIIKEEKDNYERGVLDLYYPFKRLNIVEVPIQYHAYERPYMQSISVLQPEMILIPERGAGLSSLDFNRYALFESRTTRRRESTRSQVEIETDLFRRFLQVTFFSDNIRMRSTQGNSMAQGMELIDFQGESRYTRNPYCAFPFYYSFVTGITSDEYPLFNSMVEVYLKEGFEVLPGQSFSGGLTDTERANLALKQYSIPEILKQRNPNLTSALIKQAGAFIILALKNSVGSGDFDDFFYYYLEDNAFTEISLDKFAEDFINEFNIDIVPYFQAVHKGGSLPEFLFSTPEYIQSRDNIGDVYLIRFRISNIGDTKGMVDVSLRMPGMRGFGGGGAESEKRMYELDPGISKDIQITVFDVPRLLTINTLVSGNIPSSFSTFLRSAKVNYNTEIGEYERITTERVSFRNEGEYIVDNEDEGFEYISVSNESKLKQYIDSRKGSSDEIIYESLNPWRTPAVWTPVAHTAFYGATVRSALVSSRGDGGNIVRWKEKLPEAGFYDVFVYIPLSAMMDRMPGRGRGGTRGESRPMGEMGDRQRRTGFRDQGFDYRYTVSSHVGSNEVIFTLNNIEEGWNKIGTFYFPADTAIIELSNQTAGRRVFADAVKWVKKP